MRNVAIRLSLCAVAVLAACSAPRATTGALPDARSVASRISPALTSILSLPVSDYRRRVRALLVPGTRIYRVATSEVQDGNVGYELEGTIRRVPSTQGFTLIDELGQHVTVSRSARVVANPDGMEYYLKPGQPALGPPARLVEVIPSR